MKLDEKSGGAGEVMSEAAGPQDDNNLWILWEDLQAKNSFLYLARNCLRQASGETNYQSPLLQR